MSTVLKKTVTKKHEPHNMYYETEASKRGGGFKILFKEDIYMSCFNFGGGNCCWIIILILLFCACGNGNNNGCGCENNGCNNCC